MSRSENAAGPVRNSQDDVVAAALDILDQQGLPDLTMRHLAATLGIQPSALYWHFANKQSLLAALSDRIIAGARPVDPSGLDWPARVRAEAEALRDALLAFKDGAEVVSSTLALGLGARELQRRLVRAIDDGGFDRQTSELAAATMVHFIVGHAFHQQQRIQADSLGAVAEEHALDRDEEYPPGRAEEAGRPRRPNAFDFGVTLLIAGLDRHRTTTSA